MSDHTAMLNLEQDARSMRRRSLARNFLYALRDSAQLSGLNQDTPITDVRVDFTDASERIIAPLIEAVDILESIIWASDGCVGHRDCGHSMEPWQRARALLAGKWEAYENHRNWPDMGRVTCTDCGWIGKGYQLKAQACPVCDGRVADC